MTDSFLPSIDWAQTYPRQRPGVVGHDLSGEMVLYDDGKRSAVSLNESAASIWRLCDGTRTSRDIASEFAATLGVATDDILPDVETALDELYKLNVIRDGRV